jgi:hypothetical protein
VIRDTIRRIHKLLNITYTLEFLSSIICIGAVAEKKLATHLKQKVVASAT